MLVEILKDGTYIKFPEGRSIRLKSQKLKAGDRIDYPKHYVDFLIDKGLAQEASSESFPEQTETPEAQTAYEPETLIAEEPQDINATPAAVELAKMHDIDLSTVGGSGAMGRVTVEDVRAKL